MYKCRSVRHQGGKHRLSVAGLTSALALASTVTAQASDLTTVPPPARETAPQTPAPAVTPAKGPILAPVTTVCGPAGGGQHVGRLNPSTRAFEIEIALKMNGIRLGDVPVKITPDDKVLADVKLMRTYLAKFVKPEILKEALAVPALETAPGTTLLVAKKAPGAANASVLQLASQGVAGPAPGQLGQEPPTYLLIDTIKRRGLDLCYDPIGLELRVLPTVDQRPTQRLSFEQKQERESDSLEAPAYISAYLNFRGTFGYVSQSSSGGRGFDAPEIDLDGAIRIGNFVFEGEASYYSGATAGFNSSDFQDYVFYRRGTRLVYDLPEDVLRFTAGDITPDYSGFQTAPSLLGISAQETYAQLQPTKSIRPTGSHSFRIDRPSDVDIIVDNVLFRHIKLEPGNYDLSQLPLRPGANNIKLVIVDDTGSRQTLEFTAFTGSQLLAPDITEWSFAAGIKSYDQGSVSSTAASLDSSTPAPIGSTIVTKSSKISPYEQPAYYFNQPVATATYRTGFTTSLTIDANAQADENVALVGAGFAKQTVAGLFTNEVAVSDAYSRGAGYAVRLGYIYDQFDFSSNKSIFTFLGEYRSTDFQTVNSYQTGLSSTSSLSASYSQLLPDDITAGLSFSYYPSNGQGPGNLNNGRDSWEADFSLSQAITPELTGSMTVGYGRDRAETTSSCCAAIDNGFRALVRLAWTPDAHTRVYADYDSHTQATNVSATRTSETQGVGAWTATANASAQPNGQDSISASGTYTANRAEVTLTHTAGLTGFGYGAFNPASTEERTSATVASSIVYADGAVGIGRPVTGGFAVITPHESLDGSPVTVGPPDSKTAESSFFGPAVVPNLSSYRQTRLSYDAPEAPVGYDLGTASYDIEAPYKAGYALQAGSAYTITATGTLLAATGEPISLLAGTAHEANAAHGRTVELFTNRSGRFGAQGLAPGRWIIEMPTDPEPTRYIVDIPPGVKGLHNAGVLKPASGQHQKVAEVENVR